MPQSVKTQDYRLGGMLEAPHNTMVDGGMEQPVAEALLIRKWSGICFNYERIPFCFNCVAAFFNFSTCSPYN